MNTFLEKNTLVIASQIAMQESIRKRYDVVPDEERHSSKHHMC
jgi:hypothetical protein